MLLLSSDQAIRASRSPTPASAASLSKPVREAELHDALLGAAQPRRHPTRRGAPTPGAGPDLGVRVLVVEDNPVNQIVATGLLESLGCTVDVVDDGVEAVERLTGAHGYDVVLMDCRMPRLDGFDATRQIRAHEPAGQARADHRDDRLGARGRARALPRGRDGRLPHQARRRRRARARRARVGAPAGAPVVGPGAREPPPGAGRGDGVLDADRIRMLDGLVKDGTSFFERTAASFMGRVGGQLVAIREAIDEGRRQLPAHLRPPAQGQCAQPGAAPGRRRLGAAGGARRSPAAPTAPRPCSTTWSARSTPQSRPSGEPPPGDRSQEGGVTRRSRASRTEPSTSWAIK